MSADTPDDSSIPVLTERLTLPPLELDTTLPLEPQAPTTSTPTVPLSLDTSLPLSPLPLGLPQPPPPLRPTPAAARPTPGPAPAVASRAAAAAPAPTAPVARASASVPAPTAPPARPSAPAARSSGPATTPTAPAAQPGATVDNSASHWSRIELALRSSILQAIADSLPQQIDGIVRNRMNDSIERLFTQLVAETRLAVAASLRDIVDQAVRAELARLRGQR
jgi:hypothetical protein